MNQDTLNVVREGYGAVARGTLSNDNAAVRAVAEAFGYSAKELTEMPVDANMGLSCGNPTAMASLRPGEVVVDLGCGGGMDVFLAAGKVGPAGKAIGIDMTPDMIQRARRNAQRGPDGKPYTNVEFHLATIDQLPLADASVDCIISNCVINLALDKPAVFREMLRVLRPGGRVAISDIAMKRALPADIAKDIGAYIGCIAGAISVDEYRAVLKAAGFCEVAVIDSGADLNAYAKLGGSGCCGGTPAQPSACGCDATATSPSVCCPGGTATTQSIGGSSGSATQPSVCDCGCDCDCGTVSPVLGVTEALTDILSRIDINTYSASVKVLAMKRA